MLCLVKKCIVLLCFSCERNMFLQKSICQYLKVFDIFHWHWFGNPRRNPSKSVEEPKKTSKNQKIRRNPSTPKFFIFSHFLEVSKLETKTYVFSLAVTVRNKKTFQWLLLGSFLEVSHQLRPLWQDLVQI